jgi:light-regulated signal transduction histidine kinase (bacteriophytochrome)
VVDQHFNIIIISQNILDYLGYTDEEITFRNINYFAGNEDLASTLHTELSSGFFSDVNITLFTKNKQFIDVRMSGFYSGLVSPVSDYIVLKLDNVSEFKSARLKLQQKSAELDDFIYRAAHDLRGPLATMKGLINIIKLRKDENELDSLVAMLDAHAQKMDERLFQLVYLAQSDKPLEAPLGVINFSVLETRLRKIIEKNAFVDFLEMHFSAPTPVLAGLNESLVYGLTENLLMYILSLPMNGAQSQITFKIDTKSNYLRFNIIAEGFEISDSFKEAFDHPEFIYTDLIRYPELINLYAAQKQAGHLNAEITTSIISKENQRLEVLIPLP